MKFHWGVPKPNLNGGSARAELPVCNTAKPRLKQNMKFHIVLPQKFKVLPQKLKVLPQKLRKKSHKVFNLSVKVRICI